jgi:hypothetical protein
MLGFAPYSAAAFADLGNGEQLFIPTGVEGVTAVGNVSITGDQIGLLLGSVEGTASSNGVTVDVGATTAVSEETGLIGNVGSVIASAAAGVDVTGVEATGSPGSVTIIDASVISPTGVEGTGVLGDVTVTGNQSGLTLTGVAGTMAVGTAEGQAGVGADVTGVSAASGVGSVIITGSATITPAGVFAAGQVGQALVWGRIIPDPGTNWSKVTPDPSTTWTRIAA